VTNSPVGRLEKGSSAGPAASLIKGRGEMKKVTAVLN